MNHASAAPLSSLAAACRFLQSAPAATHAHLACLLCCLSREARLRQDARTLSIHHCHGFRTHRPGAPSCNSSCTMTPMHQSADAVVPCAAAGAAKLLLVSTGTTDMTAAKPLLPRATPAAGGCCLQRHDSPKKLAACCRSCQLACQLSYWLWQLWQTQMPKQHTDSCRASHSEAGCAGAGSERRSRSASAAESGSAWRASASSDAARDSTCTAGPQSSCIHEFSTDRSM